VVTTTSPSARQGSGVVELTNTIDVLTEIGNKCAHNIVLLFGSIQQAHRERR
jgi:hypothetical protein